MRTEALVFLWPGREILGFWRVSLGEAACFFSIPYDLCFVIRGPLNSEIAISYEVFFPYSCSIFSVSFFSSFSLELCIWFFKFLKIKGKLTGKSLNTSSRLGSSAWIFLAWDY